MLRMSASGITEVRTSNQEKHNPGESEVDRLFSNFGAALAQLSREKITDFLSIRGGQPPTAAAGRPVLEVVTGHEMLEALSTALRYAPQGPLTQDLYPTLVQHQSIFTQVVSEMFPEDPDKERELAALVRALRASLHPTSRR